MFPKHQVSQRIRLCCRRITRTFVVFSSSILREFSTILYIHFFLLSRDEKKKKKKRLTEAILLNFIIISARVLSLNWTLPVRKIGTSRDKQTGRVRSLCTFFRWKNKLGSRHFEKLNFSPYTNTQVNGNYT